MRTRSTVVMIAALLTVSLVAFASPASADLQQWGGDKTCAPGQQCLSRSATSGPAGSFPDQYTTHKHNTAYSTRWPLTSARTLRSYKKFSSRVNWHVFSTGEIWNASATCV